MTLPASGTITIGMVAAELSITLPLSLGDSRVRALAGVPSGPISLSNLYGKSAYNPMTAAGFGDSVYVDSTFSGGTASAYPYVTVMGGTGAYTYLWSFTSNPNGCTLASTTALNCRVSKTYARNATGSASAVLQCVISDGVASVTVGDIPAQLDWGI